MEPKNIPKPLRGRALLPSGLLCKKMKKKTKKKKKKKKKKKPRAEAAEEIARVSVGATHTQIRFFMAPFPTDSADHSHVACFATCESRF